MKIEMVALLVLQIYLGLQSGYPPGELRKCQSSAPALPDGSEGSVHFNNLGTPTARALPAVDLRDMNGLLLLSNDVESNPGPVTNKASSPVEGSPPPSPFKQTEGEGITQHKTDGARASQHGFYYQVKQIMKWVHRAHTSGFNYFQLCTENSELGKFDDFYIKLEDGPKSFVQQFIQLKHGKSYGNQSVKPITSSDLLPEQSDSSALDLRCYFKSYLKISQNQIFKSSKCTKNQFIIYSNRHFDFNTAAKQSLFMFKENMFETVTEDLLLKTNLQKLKLNFSGRSKLLHIISDDQKEHPLVENFLNNLYFAVNQESESDLEAIIKKEFENNAAINAIDRTFNRLNYDVHEWINAPKGTMFDNKFIYNYFEKVRVQFNDNVSRHVKISKFNLPSPISNFCARAEEITTIAKHIDSESRDGRIDVAVVGLGGVGKSELVRKYAEMYEHKFQFIFNINAETLQSTFHSFLGIVKKFKILSKDIFIDAIPHASIKEYVYSHFENFTCLFIFDNAETLHFKDKKRTTFFPESSKNRPFVILTSRVDNWSCKNTIKLGAFSPNDAVKFLHDNLDCGRSGETLLALATKLDNLPLALQLAVSTIQENVEMYKNSVDQEYSCEQYLRELENEQDKLLSLGFESNHESDYEHSLQGAWNMSMKNVLKCENGDISIYILFLISFLEPDNISKLFLENLRKHINIADRVYLRAMSHLAKYMIIITKGENYSIHRLLQAAARASLREKQFSSTENVLHCSTLDILRKLLEYFDSLSGTGFFYFPDSYIEHIFSVWNYMIMCKDLCNILMLENMKLAPKIFYDLNKSSKIENSNCIRNTIHLMCKNGNTNNEHINYMNRELAYFYIVSKNTTSNAKNGFNKILKVFESQHEEFIYTKVYQAEAFFRSRHPALAREIINSIKILDPNSEFLVKRNHFTTKNAWEFCLALSKYSDIEIEQIFSEAPDLKIKVKLREKTTQEHIKDAHGYGKKSDLPSAMVALSHVITEEGHPRDEMDLDDLCSARSCLIEVKKKQKDYQSACEILELIINSYEHVVVKSLRYRFHLIEISKKMNKEHSENIRNLLKLGIQYLTSSEIVPNHFSLDVPQHEKINPITCRKTFRDLLSESISSITVENKKIFINELADQIISSCLGGEHEYFKLLIKTDDHTITLIEDEADLQLNLVKQYIEDMTSEKDLLAILMQKFPSLSEVMIKYKKIKEFFFFCGYLYDQCVEKFGEQSDPALRVLIWKAYEKMNALEFPFYGAGEDLARTRPHVYDMVSAHKTITLVLAFTSGWTRLSLAQLRYDLSTCDVTGRQQLKAKFDDDVETTFKKFKFHISTDEKVIKKFLNFLETDELCVEFDLLQLFNSI